MKHEECLHMVLKNLTEVTKNITGKTFSLTPRNESQERLKNVMTCDKMWIFQYTLGIKRQPMHWKTPTSLRMKKASRE
jgi:hypothetical protein